MVGGTLLVWVHGRPQCTSSVAQGNPTVNAWYSDELEIRSYVNHNVFFFTFFLISFSAAPTGPEIVDFRSQMLVWREEEAEMEAELLVCTYTHIGAIFLRKNYPH